MGPRYLQVAEALGTEPIELPTEADGSLLLTTLSAQFPGVSGLKFRNAESGGMRGLRLADGRFHSPEEEGGWGDHIYYCVMQKVDKKRKWDSSGDEEDREDSRKNKKLENKPKKSKCSDLIVLSLPHSTTDIELKQYFQCFGDLALAKVKKDAQTGASKGYGFIRFSTLESQIRVLGQRHRFEARWCDVKIPNSKDARELNVSPKVYVGRLTEDITVDDLREYFSSFGQVSHVYTPKPFRAFAFVTFVHSSVAQSLLGEEHVIKGTTVVISHAAPSRLSNSAKKDNNEDKESESRKQKTSGTGTGQGMIDAALESLNFPPQLKEAIASAVLNQVVTGLVGGKEGQGLGLGQIQQQGGDQSSSPQKNWTSSSSSFGDQNAGIQVSQWKLF